MDGGAVGEGADIVGFLVSLTFTFTFLLPGGRPLGLFDKPGMNDDDNDVVVLVTGALLLAVVTTIDTFGVVILAVVAATVPVDVVGVETGWIVQPIPEAPM